MIDKSKIVITISRQLGSGGAFVGQQLAKKMDIFYLDREIIKQVAEKISVLECEVESCEEKIPTFWQSFFRLGTYTSPDVYIPPQIFVPSGKDLFKIEEEIIKRVVNERPAIVIGRCGSHILRDNPNHISIFLYADIDFRVERVKELYKVSHDEANKMIVQSDKERGRYHSLLTKKDWNDAKQYNLSIETSKISLDNTIKLILDYIEFR